MSPLVEVKELHVSHPARSRARKPIRALKGVTFSVMPGEFLAIIGRSGAGKTTLLRSISGFVRPDSGRLVVNGFDMQTATTRELYRLRRSVATIYQGFNLVERASAFENALYGRLGATGTLHSLVGLFKDEDRARAFDALQKLGLAERAYQRVDRLSGGERQRVAIARALVQQPRIVLADEPAASLDISLTRFVLDTLRRQSVEQGMTVLVNLHNLDLATEYATRILALRAGGLMFDGPARDLTPTVQEAIYRGDESRASDAGTPQGAETKLA